MNENLNETTNEKNDSLTQKEETLTDNAAEDNAVKAEDSANEKAPAVSLKEDEPKQEEADTQNDEDEQEDENDEEENISPFFKKLRSFSPKKAKRFQIIYGIFCGIICYLLLIFQELLRDIVPDIENNQLIIYIVFGVMAAIIVLNIKMGKKTGWDMIPYRLGLAGGVGIAIVAYILYHLITKGTLA